MHEHWEVYSTAKTHQTFSHLSSFQSITIPSPRSLTLTLTDSNCGPQDQSKPTVNSKPLKLFKSCSLSGYVIWYGGPIHWVSKCQAITARSSAQVEIYATDECTKFLLFLQHISNDFGIKQELFGNPTSIYNDNSACVTWSGNMTTKGLRHIQIRKNAIREVIAANIIQVNHIAGTVNLANLFTKEDKDA